MTDGSRKAIIAAFLANLGIALSKFVGFLLTGSTSLLAETIHSLADTGNQALLFLGGKRAQREATETHQFGYGRERYFWAFAVALVLFSMGGMFALYEGIEKLRHPHELESIPIAITILLIAVALEGWSLRTAVHESRHVKRASASWWEFIHTTREPELPVVLLEDFGALIGLFVAIVGVGLAGLTGNARFDAAGSVTIGVLLIAIAIVLATEMKSLLIGESATEDESDAIVAAIESSPDVSRLIHMRTEHLAPDVILIGAKVEFPPALTAAELIAALNATEDRIRAAVPAAKLIYLEPDRFDPERD